MRCEDKEVLGCPKAFVPNVVDSMQDGLLDSPNTMYANVVVK
jgi:hypothetical protein